MKLSILFPETRSVERAIARIEELEHDEQDRLRLLDLWVFQKREIDDAKLQLGEDERLEVLLRRPRCRAAAVFWVVRPGVGSPLKGMNGAVAQIARSGRGSLGRVDPLAALGVGRPEIGQSTNGEDAP